MKQILNITHTDQDGIGCCIVCRYFYGKDNVEFLDVPNKQTDYVICNFIKNEEYKKYEKIYITDINFSEATAEKINELVEKGYDIKLFDHHPTAEFLNKYKWATVEKFKKSENNSLIKTCATELLFDFLSESTSSVIANYVEKVKRYDTWLWKERYNDLDSKKLNDLFRMLSKQKYISIIESSYYHIDSILDMYGFLIESEQEKIKEYIEKKEQEMKIHYIKYKNKKIKAGIVFASEYVSELGNTLCINNDIDLAIMIADGTISYRTVKKNIDVSEIAKYFGNGGGHYQAAGSTISEKNKIRYIKNLFKHKFIF